MTVQFLGHMSSSGVNAGTKGLTGSMAPPWPLRHFGVDGGPVLPDGPAAGRRYNGRRRGGTGRGGSGTRPADGVGGGDQRQAFGANGVARMESGNGTGNMGKTRGDLLLTKYGEKLEYSCPGVEQPN